MAKTARLPLAKDGNPLGSGSLPTANRSAITNDPLATRAKATTARGRRVRDLFRDLIAGKEEAGAYVAAQCLRVAELTASAESLRAQLGAMLDEAKGKTVGPDEIKSLAVLVNAVTRFESTARRAAADLGKVAPADDGPDWIDLQEEATRLREAERDSK